MKKANKSSFLPVPEQHYSKHYLLRKAQELEAEQEIREYDGETTSDLPDPPGIECRREGS